ncbi:CAP domain-containing protein [Streptomyces sp. DH24]|uniref:CAP domain-containing protein n=1 Tax=Streptomyces sp. DH24 TaxID=3040123 RepID=UPI002441C62C|nr:CAP domain-containing protein [Streptomyces sp. DH24]MDG9719354.1 CAP domain-containing protein [Streptomyces sp. DH24]
MGRHRRSAAGRAATGRAAGGTQQDGHQGHHEPADSRPSDGPAMGIAPYLNPEAYAETYAKSEAFLYATDDDHTPASGTRAFPAEGFAGGGQGPDGGSARAGGHRRRRKRAAPVRTGLLGVSAAVALGTVAVATGAVPGLDNYRIGGGSGAGDRVQAADSPTSTPSEQGGTSGSVEGRDGTSPGRGTDRSASPSASTSPSPSASTSSAAPTTEAPSKKPKATPSEKPQRTPTRQATKAPVPSTPPVTVSEEAAAAAQVLKLVNDERAQAGCSPVAANSALSELAADFSEDMAERNFFDHTDPSGATPWDRAEKAGITNLGGENIARGQADAAAVMAAWMDSPGHRANILNCDFKTLGVGVHFGQGGPWWTQNFGY